MARVLFICRHRAEPIKGGLATGSVPAVLSVQAAQGGFPLWGFHAAGWSVGVANVTAEQRSALEADPDCAVVDFAMATTMTVAEIPTAMRTRLADVLDENGVPLPSGTDTIAEALRKVANVLSPGLTRERVETFLSRRGV